MCSQSISARSLPSLAEPFRWKRPACRTGSTQLQPLRSDESTPTLLGASLLNRIPPLFRVARKARKRGGGYNNYVTWDRGMNSFEDMVNFWSGLGFLVQSGSTIVETERTL